MLYNKLIRDKVPEILNREGVSFTYRILSSEEVLLRLGDKLVEETKEFLESGNIVELCDIQEVILAIASIKGVSEEALNIMRTVKADKKGKFEKGIFLISTD